jgi:hypothetical protein
LDRWLTCELRGEGVPPEKRLRFFHRIDQGHVPKVGDWFRTVERHPLLGGTAAYFANAFWEILEEQLGDLSVITMRIDQLLAENDLVRVPVVGVLEVMVLVEQGKLPSMHRDMLISNLRPLNEIPRIELLSLMTFEAIFAHVDEITEGLRREFDFAFESSSFGQLVMDDSVGGRDIYLDIIDAICYPQKTIAVTSEVRHASSYRARSLVVPKSTLESNSDRRVDE